MPVIILRPMQQVQNAEALWQKESAASWRKVLCKCNNCTMGGTQYGIYVGTRQHVVLLYNKTYWPECMKHAAACRFIILCIFGWI